MAVINVSSNDKDIELTSLEAHVGLCNQRQKSLEGKINEMKEQQQAYKKMIFRACLALVTCGLSGITALIIHLSGKLL
jgi:hypothetical protein